jgi:hypothetical protein
LGRVGSLLQVADFEGFIFIALKPLLRRNFGDTAEQVNRENQ